MSNLKTIYCCACKKDVSARLISGAEVYPHRQDLHNLPFWTCDNCGNFVGCHHKTSNPTNPLGVIPCSQMKEYRKKIHQILDPLWKSGKMSRSAVYKMVSDKVGWEYHTAKIRTLREAKDIVSIAENISAEYYEIDYF